MLNRFSRRQRASKTGLGGNFRLASRQETRHLRAAITRPRKEGTVSARTSAGGIQITPQRHRGKEWRCAIRPQVGATAIPLPYGHEPDAN